MKETICGVALGALLISAGAALAQSVSPERPSTPPDPMETEAGFRQQLGQALYDSGQFEAKAAQLRKQLMGAAAREKEYIAQQQWWAAWWGGMYPTEPTPQAK